MYGNNYEGRPRDGRREDKTMSSTASPAFIVRTVAGVEEFASSADAVARFDEIAATNTPVEYLERSLNESGDENDSPEMVTDLIRVAGGPLRHVAIPEAGLHVLLDALRNYRVDVDELDGFLPWSNYSSARDEDQLANEAGTSQLLSDATAAVAAAIDAASTAEEAATGREHILTVRVVLDSADASKVAQFKTEAETLIANQLREAFQGPPETLGGYEGATIASGPYVDLSSL